jgi:hypothetical protein
VAGRTMPVQERSDVLRVGGRAVRAARHRDRQNEGHADPLVPDTTRRGHWTQSGPSPTFLRHSSATASCFAALLLETALRFRCGPDPTIRRHSGAGIDIGPSPAGVPSLSTRNAASATVRQNGDIQRLPCEPTGGQGAMANPRRAWTGCAEPPPRGCQTGST